MKKCVAVLMTITMLLSLAACGRGDDDVDHSGNDSSGRGQTNAVLEGFVLEGNLSEKETVEMGTPAVQLDPQTVYGKLTYTPQMFYGCYELRGGDEAREKFGAESEYFTWTRNGQKVEFSKLPFKIETGKATFSHAINYVEEHNWMRLYFMHRYGENQCSLDEVICAYTIEGNKLILTPLDTFSVDNETGSIMYTFADTTWEYMFSFNGRDLSLSSDGSDVILTTGLDAYGEVDYFALGQSGYLSQGSKSVTKIDRINFMYDSEDNKSWLRVELADGKDSFNSIALIQENGLFTVTLALEDGVTTYQYVYFYCGDDGLILTDGNEVYYYNDTYSDRYKSDLREFVGVDQTQKLDTLSDFQLEELVEKKANLLEDLAAAYEAAGLNVTINKQTGEIAMDSTVLFGTDESQISDEGKIFLKRFMQVYTSVVFSDEYTDFLSKIMVEGHTDTRGEYDMNLELSQARADSVREYCMSADCGVDGAYANTLNGMLQAVGYSYDKPVYDANGEVDMDASRRVSFRFIINLG